MNVITFLYIFGQNSNSLTHRKMRIAFFRGRREYARAKRKTKTDQEKGIESMSPCKCEKSMIFLRSPSVLNPLDREVLEYIS
jgi:hypothetical protein